MTVNGEQNSNGYGAAWPHGSRHVYQSSFCIMLISDGSTNTETNELSALLKGRNVEHCFGPHFAPLPSSVKRGRLF